MWKMEVDPKVNANSNSAMNFLKTYSAERDESVVRTVKLMRYKLAKLDQIAVYFSNSAQANNFLKLFEGSPVNVRAQTPGSILFKGVADETHSSIFSSNLMKFDPSIKEVLIDIAKQLGHRFALGADVPALDKMSFDDALATAKAEQAVGNDALIFEFAQFYYQKIFSAAAEDAEGSQNLYHLLDAIEPNNEYYARAQDMLVDALMSQDKGGMTVEESREASEFTFRHALKGTRPELTDQLYAELCGKSLGEDFVRDIKGEADTLVSLAQQFFKMSQQLKSSHTSSPSFFSPDGAADKADGAADFKKPGP